MVGTLHPDMEAGVRDSPCLPIRAEVPFHGRFYQVILDSIAKMKPVYRIVEKVGFMLFGGIMWPASCSAVGLRRRHRVQP